MLNSILLSELQQIFENGNMDDVLSGVPLDEVITEADGPDDSDWNARTSELHHWQTLAGFDELVGADVKKNITNLEKRISAAENLYLTLENDGVIFSVKSRSEHLEQWSEALQAFREIASL